MPIEVEIKARIDDPEKIVRTLSERGVFQRRYEKEDRYFGAPGSTAQFRLRRDGGRLICTFKEKKVDDRFEVNRECEFGVSDETAFERFAAHLGYECVTEKRKVGRSWLVGAVRCELSEVSALGFFLELEIVLPEDSDEEERDRAKEQLFAMLSELGVDESNVEARPYTRMIHENISRRDGVPCSAV